MDFTTDLSIPTTEFAPIAESEHVSPQHTDDRDADARLVGALRRGDACAFEQLVRQHGPRMLAAARRLLRNEQDAADALQDALLSVYRNAHTFAGGSSFRTWLHRVALNSALMRLRTRRRFEREQALPDGLLPHFDGAGRHAQPIARWRDDGSNDVCSVVATSELRAQVRACIDQLPEAYRTVLLLRDIEGLDTDEAADMLGTTSGNVKTRLHRARQALRTMLAPHFIGEAQAN